jgi:hypothetical protein
LIYEGKDITGAVNIKSADIYDNAGGVADKTELVFADAESLWSKWKPAKGHKLIIKNQGFSSGLMYVDEWYQSRGLFRLKAISTPLSSKTTKTRSWENIRFLKLASDIAQNQGLTLQTFNITDWLYERADQVDKTDLEFLNERCILEGYCLKITDGKAVIYNEALQENESPVKTIYRSSFIGDYDFHSISNGLYSGCIVRHMTEKGELIKHEFMPVAAPCGPVLKKDIPLNNQGEAERYAKGFLRYSNKHETVGLIKIKLDMNIAAGNMVRIADVGMADGNYFIDRIIPKLTSDISILNLRKPLEGY